MLLLLACPFVGSAQYKFPIEPFFSYFKHADRYEIGVNYVMPTGTFDGVTPVLGYNNYYLGDTTIRRSLKANPGYGASVGIAVPFAATGHIALFAVSIHAMFNQYSFDQVNSYMSVEDGSFKKSPANMTSTTSQIALPIGIDWKIGSDAICSKRLFFSAALGAGVMPQVNLTSVSASGGPTGTTFNATPYFKAEGAVYVGINVRIRAMYYPGNVRLIDNPGAIPGYSDGPFRLTNNGNFMVSLILQPFSKRWSESSWYNDYDSYNWNEHLN